jgi:transcriptional regulator with XRE-family HTH domain
MDYLLLCNTEQKNIMRTNVDTAIIEKVREMRQARDVSQAVLAEVIETGRGFVGQVETKDNYAKYSAYQIYLIAEFFECEVSDIYPPIKSAK